MMVTLELNAEGTTGRRNGTSGNALGDSPATPKTRASRDTLCRGDVERPLHRPRLNENSFCSVPLDLPAECGERTRHALARSVTSGDSGSTVCFLSVIRTG